MTQPLGEPQPELDRITRIALRQAEIDARIKIAAIVVEHVKFQTMEQAITSCDKLWKWAVSPTVQENTMGSSDK